MILSIESSIPTFKTLRFHEGLNVLLAYTKPGSTDRQTRNSAGKTSVIEILHFLYGAKCDKDSLFRTESLIDHFFSANISIDGNPLRISRTGSDPSKIFLLEGHHMLVDLPKNSDMKRGREFVSNINWRVYLGSVLFGMPSNLRGTVYEQSFTPTFRSVFSYFARRRNSGGYTHAERNAEKQQRWDWQVNLSYLLGLDWEIPSEFQRVRVRERTLEELRKATKGGAFGEMLGSVAELRPQVAVAETRAQKLSEQLARFQVLDSYLELFRRAARAKTEMQAIGREAVVLHETLDHLMRALKEEEPPGNSDLQRLYQAAGIELPAVALRRFEDVNRFYESVIDTAARTFSKRSQVLRVNFLREDSASRSLTRSAAAF